MKTQKIDWNGIFRNSGITLLFFVINVLIVSTALFFIKISITPFHMPIALTITILEMLMIYKNKTSIKQIIISIIVAVSIFVLSVLLVSNIYDWTWDGNTYHKTAVGSLKNGWNPVYEKVEDFTIEKGNEIDLDTKEKNKIWVNHYPKASWIFAANIYSITNSIEASKILNILMMYVSITLIGTYLMKKMNKIWASIISILIIINPVIITQIFNYYIDGLLGMGLCIIIYTLLAITEMKKDVKNNKFELKEHFIILACCILLVINLKFTGLVYAAILCFLFYMYWLYQAHKEGNLKEKIIKYTKFYTIVVLISILFVGYTPYMKNFIDKGHPFYPLFGKDKVDIMTHNQPYNFKNKDVVKKFAISMLAEGSNIHVAYENNKEKPKLKIPFTIQEKELTDYAQPDTRMAGFGPLYSGIFIISCCCTIYIIYSYIKNKQFNKLIPYLLILIAMAILVLATDGSWWARYTPYLWILPIFNIIYFANKKSKVTKIIASVLSILIMINVSIIIYANFSKYLKNYANVQKDLQEFKNYANTQSNVEVLLKTSEHEGIKYNIADLGIDTTKIKYVKKIEKNKKVTYLFWYCKK